MNDLANTSSLASSPTTTGVVSLRQLLEHHPIPPPSLIEPGLLPASGLLFLGGEPKLGKSILAANLALALAAGSPCAGFDVPLARRVLICQFELPVTRPADTGLQGQTTPGLNHTS